MSIAWLCRACFEQMQRDVGHEVEQPTIGFFATSGCMHCGGAISPKNYAPIWTKAFEGWQRKLGYDQRLATGPDRS